MRGRLVSVIVAAAVLATGGTTATAAEAPKQLVPPRAQQQQQQPAPKAAAPAPRATPAAAPAAAAAAPARTLKVGVEGAYPPFSEMTPDGKIRGFDIDIANALCAEIRARCLLVQQDHGRLQDGLVGRQTDLVVASLSMTEERRRRYAFTDKYYQVPAKFVARRGEAPARFDADGLKGVRVGVLAGSVHASFLVDQFGGVVDVVPFPTLPDALAALDQRRIGLVFGDALVLDREFLRSEEGRGFEFAGPGLVDPDWFGDGVGIALRKEDAALRQQLNQALGRMRADGRYQEIARRYFAFDIYGGEPGPIRRERREAKVPPRPQRDLPRLIDGTTGDQRR
jgi:arginine/ornithine transport system substrate-binding protein